MKYNKGDLVLVNIGQLNNSLGVILSSKKIKETKTLDDLWLTKIYEEYNLYKVLVHGKIKTYTDGQIIKKV